MLVLENASTKVLNRLAVSKELPFGGKEAFDANWTASVNAPSGDAHFGAEAKAVAIRKSR